MATETPPRGLDDPDPEAGADLDVGPVEEMADLEPLDPGEEGTILGRLRAKRQELARRKPLFLDIPGFDSELVARYQRIEWDEANKIGTKAAKNKNPKAMLGAHIDVLIRGCSGIFVRDDGKLKPLTVQGVPVDGFDEQLAAALALEGTSSARGVLLATFPSELSVSAHYAQFEAWLADPDNAQDEDELGE